jgi:hypothetical protein
MRKSVVRIRRSGSVGTKMSRIHNPAFHKLSTDQAIACYFRIPKRKRKMGFIQDVGNIKERRMMSTRVPDHCLTICHDLY